MTKSYFCKEYVSVRLMLIVVISVISNLTWMIIATSGVFDIKDIVMQKDFFKMFILGILEIIFLIELPFYIVWKSLTLNDKHSIKIFSLTVLLALAISILFSWAFTLFKEGTTSGTFLTNVTSDLLISFFATIVFTILIHKNMVNGLMMEKEKILKEKTRLAEATAIAQADAMNMRIDNHFFFNSFSVLASLIREDPQKAEDFLLELTDTHRSILILSNEKSIPLYKELKLLDSYMTMTRYRFGSGSINLVFSPDTEEYEDAHIIPLSLLHLVENAIKHNSYSEERPLSINVGFEESKNGTFLTVSNNKQEKISKPASTRQGLENIRRKYQLVSGKVPVIEDKSDLFIVKLPIIEKWTY